MHAHAEIPLNFQLRSVPHKNDRTIKNSRTKRDHCREAAPHQHERKPLCLLYPRLLSNLGGSPWLRREF